MMYTYPFRRTLFEMSVSAKGAGDEFYYFAPVT